MTGSKVSKPWQPGVIDLYIFAHNFDVRPLRESIINQKWYDGYMQGDIYTYEDMAAVDQELPAISPLRRLVVDAFATFWSPELHTRCTIDFVLFKNLPPELLFRGMALLAAKRDDSDFMKKLNLPCVYHEHDDTQAARDACRDKYESVRKRKLEELNRAQHVWEAISGGTRGS